jgi:hypothetical protein
MRHSHQNHSKYDPSRQQELNKAHTLQYNIGMDSDRAGGCTDNPLSRQDEDHSCRQDQFEYFDDPSFHHVANSYHQDEYDHTNYNPDHDTFNERKQPEHYFYFQGDAPYDKPNYPEPGDIYCDQNINIPTNKSVFDLRFNNYLII